jgi:hypothetical protein
MVAKTHLPEHVIGTKDVDSQFISVARDRHLLDEARADQNQVICWLARFKDWFGRANVPDWSAEECRAERATHEARQIEAVRVRPGGVARGLVDVIRVLGDHQTRTTEIRKRVRVT